MSEFLGIEPTVWLEGPRWIVAGVLLLGAAILSWRRPAAGLGLVVAALPLYQVRGNIGVPTTFLELLLGAVLLGVVAARPGWPRLPRLYGVGLAAWVGGSFLAALVGPDLREGLGLWRAFFGEPALWLLAASAVFRQGNMRWLLVGALGCIGTVAAGTILQLLQGSGITYDFRLAGPFQSPNFIALLLVPLMLLAVFWPRCELVAWRIVAAVTAAELLLLSESRGGVLALLVGLAAGGLLVRRTWPAVLRTGLWGVLAAGMVLAAVMVGRADPNQTRRLLWEEAVRDIRADPLFGTGPGQFQDVFREQVKDDHYQMMFVVPFAPNPHNIWLVIWTEWGVAALSGFVALLAAALLAARTNRGWAPAAVAMLAAVLAHGLIDTPVLKNDLAILFMVVLLLPLLSVPGRTR